MMDMFASIALTVAGLFWGVWALFALYRIGIRPIGRLLRGCRRLSWFAQMLLAVIFVGMTTVAGSTEPDHPGADMSGFGHAGTAWYGGGQTGTTGRVVWDCQTPAVGEGSAYSLHLTRADETFDFSMPPNATVAANWLAHGAATAWIRIRPTGWEFPFGTNVVTGIAVSADGRVMPDPTDPGICFAPLAMPLGLAPEANWGLLPGTNLKSRFWWAMEADGLVCTWENALVGCRAEDPVSFQVAFSPTGNFTYRYDWSRMTSEVEDECTSVSFRSVNEASCDAVRSEFDAILGNAEPFASPSGSAYTVLEHAFYSGSTNGDFVLPSSSDGMAVLRVTASGSGRGELLVGGRVVPLLADPSSSSVTLLLPIEKGVTQRLYVRGDETLDVILDSDDFAFGPLPDHRGSRRMGWINFPNTEATHPCIHGRTANDKEVFLPTGEDAGDIACMWVGSDEVEVENQPPRAARMTGRFGSRREASVTYTVSHPFYLFGQTWFEQTVRHCPPLSWGDETDYSDDSDPYADECWCCHWRTCDTDCSCGCYGCGAGTDSLSNDYSFASTNWPHMQNVLKIRTPHDYTDECVLTVPTGVRSCCGCPEHGANCVSLVHASHVGVVDSAGAAFQSSEVSLAVRIAATEPSLEPYDGAAHFATNGMPSLSRDYTCLGVSFSHETVDLAELNRVNRRFGLPVVVNTNLDESVALRLNVNVLLRGGRIRLGIEDATAPFSVWQYDVLREEYVKLADTTTALDLSMAEWRKLTRHVNDGDVPNTYVLLSSSQAGRATLVLHYWNVIDGEFVEDEARQVVTAIYPPLFPDFNRDGLFDTNDMVSTSHKAFYFWTNRDVWKNDDAFDTGFWDYIRGLLYDTNGDDDQVNGRNDLVNLLPLAIDVRECLSNWGVGKVRVTIRAARGVPDSVRRCYADISWNDAKSGVLSDVTTDDESRWWQVPYDPTLQATRLRTLSQEGDALSRATVLRCMNSRGVMFVEAINPCFAPIEIAVKLGAMEVLTYCPKLQFSDVDTMYRWHNIRSGTAPAVGSVVSPSGWPDADRDDANLYFVHGYNVSVDEGRSWGRAFFKRMWWSGMNAKFHVVTWYGNDTQLYFPGVGLVTPNYHVNVEHAFASSSNLVAVAEQYPGRKYYVAHSLGNMLVSSAIQDWALPHDKYMLLNAAVPIEAYDTSTSAVNTATMDRMTPRSWVGYPDSLRASRWCDLFSAGDPRRSLTWKGRFSRVVNAINYYSSEEEVLKCGFGEGRQPLQRAYSWYNQERIKGVKPIESGLGRSEGGWGFNMAHYCQDLYWDGESGQNIPYVRLRTPLEATQLLDKPNIDFKSVPFFGWFEERSIFTNVFLEAGSVSRALESQLLADAIPAESLPAGFTEIPLWNSQGADNIDMALGLKDNVLLLEEDNRAWGHSFFLSAPYMVVFHLFDEILRQTRQGD